MQVQKLIEELQKLPKDLEIGVEYSQSDCQGHGPDEYCYCGYSTERRGVGYLTIDNHNEKGRKLTKKQVTIHFD